jgi:hypothetical protein
MQKENLEFQKKTKKMPEAHDEINQDVDNVCQATKHDETQFLTLLTELKVIGQLKMGQRLNTTKKTLSVEPVSYFSGIRRWWNGEKHKINIPAVQSRLQKAFKIVATELKSKKQRQSIVLQRTYKALKEVAEGLVQLRDEYKKKNYQYAQCQLQVEIESIKIYTELVERHNQANS